MRKLPLAVASCAIVALMSATPAFAFTTYGGSSFAGSGANFADPDAQIDQMTGTSDTGGSGLMEFGGSQMQADAAQRQLSGQVDEKDSSCAAFDYACLHKASAQERKDPLSFSGFYFPPD